MHEHRTWSIGLGRWGPVEVRLHLFLLLFAALTMLLSCVDKQATDLAPVAAFALVILVASVILHEFGHYVVASRLGGGTEALILGPFGGLVPVRVPHDPRGELFANLAGPATNLVIAIVCLVPLCWSDGLSMTQLANPLNPPLWDARVESAAENSAFAGLRMAVWINWTLFLINLIPAFPFDGGRVLTSLLVAARSPHGHRRALWMVTLTAKIFAVVLCGVAWFVRSGQWDSGQLIPTWFALVLLAIFIYFSARVEEAELDEVPEFDENTFGYDFSQGYISLERSDQESAEPPQRQRGVMGRWLEARREERARKRMAIEEEEDRRMDEILTQLHETGFENLSPEDQALLNRVSARYRNRSGRSN